MNILSRWVVGLLLATFLPGLSAQTDARKKASLAQMSLWFPRSEPWEKWLRTTGEQPPDFEALPAEPYLPDPLRMTDGRPVTAASQWPDRRRELFQIFERYTLGGVPAAPGNVRVANDRMRQEGLITVHAITIEFGPAYAAKLYLETYIPPGNGPFPVFITQGVRRNWALLAAGRGYLSCTYAASDSRDDSAAYNGIWPKIDWSTLTRRAWTVGRVLDYLVTLPQADQTQIALVGHANDGKAALTAAALDERIKAVVLSSSGVGGACPFRFFTESQLCAGIEPLTRENPEWFHPRLRFFAGRENKLPIDQNELLACVAPRACLISTALNDPQDSAWAVEQCQASALRVYSLLGAPGALSLIHRSGPQNVKAEDIEGYLDWIDGQFGRRAIDPTVRRIFPTYTDWLQISGEKVDPQSFLDSSMLGLLVSAGGNPMASVDEWTARRKEILARVAWGLGDMPPCAEAYAETRGAEPVYVAEMLDRAQAPTGVAKRSVSFGSCVAGDLYFPSGADISGQKLPVIIWLHPLPSATGYTPAYHAREPIYFDLARAGFAVFTFDQIGSGQRIDEVRKYLSRYPHGSLLGRTVQDVRAAVDALSRADFINPKRIFVAGYGTGGAAALYATALEERIVGAISIAGFTPMRFDTAEKGTGGAARWGKWMPLAPRLGAFVGKESRIPYDFHEIIASIAPRPVLIMAPQYDYQTTPTDIAQCVEAARKVYELLHAETNLALYMADDYNRFSPAMQHQFLEQMKKMLQLFDK